MTPADGSIERSLTFGTLSINSFWSASRILQRISLTEDPPTSLSPEDLLDATLFLRSVIHLPPTQPTIRGHVLSRIQQIPWGETLTYGGVALDCGTSPRAVGAICASNTLLIAIPCHRVVGATSQGGFAAGPVWKSLLLATEKLSR